MQNNIPMNMLYIRVETDGVDTADARRDVPRPQPHLHPRGVPALREPRMREGVPDGRLAQDRGRTVQIDKSKCIGCHSVP